MTGGAGEIVQVDGKQISVQTTFTDESTGANTEGAVAAICP